MLPYQNTVKIHQIIHKFVLQCSGIESRKKQRAIDAQRLAETWKGEPSQNPRDSRQLHFGGLEINNKHILLWRQI